MVSFEEANADRADARLVEGTTVAHVCYDVPPTVTDATVGEVRAALTARRYESAADVAVCRDDHLVGLVPVDVAGRARRSADRRGDGPGSPGGGAGDRPGGGGLESR
jgi:hypothetical protein